MGDKKHRRIRDLNHTLSKRLVEFAKEVNDPVLKMEDLEDIRENSEWSRVHSWYFHQLQQFIVYKANREDVRVETVPAYKTSQRCSHCGHTERANRDGGHSQCRGCGYGRHSDLNAAENIAYREGEPGTA